MLRITLACLLSSLAGAQEMISLRSGNGPPGGPDAVVTVLQGPFFAPFTVLEYASAASPTSASGVALSQPARLVVQ
jgi:hypothetical protein